MVACLEWKSNGLKHRPPVWTGAALRLLLIPDKVSHSTVTSDAKVTVFCFVLFQCIVPFLPKSLLCIISLGRIPHKSNTVEVRYSCLGHRAKLILFSLTPNPIPKLQIVSPRHIQITEFLLEFLQLPEIFLPLLGKLVGGILCRLIARECVDWYLSLSPQER